CRWRRARWSPTRSRPPCGAFVTPLATSWPGSGDRMLEASLDVTQVDRAMADVEARAKRLAPAFRELRRPLRQDQRAHARDEQGPDGRWPPRSPLTEARRLARNRRARASEALSTRPARRRSPPNHLLGLLPVSIHAQIGAP